MAQYQGLTEQGNTDMHALTDDRTMVVHEYDSAEGHVALRRQDLQTLRDEARAYEAASKDDVAVMVRSSEEQVLALRNEANACRCGLESQRDIVRLPQSSGGQDVHKRWNRLRTCRWSMLAERTRAHLNVF